MNNTIKIPVKVTTVEETFVEVELPCYTKLNQNVYSVNEESKCISVWINGDWAFIGCVSHNSAFVTGYQLITKAEYDEQFEKALSILKGESL